MKLAVVISQTDAETVFNALRLANFALKEGDVVETFLIGKGVEIESIPTDRFRIDEQIEAYRKAGGQFLACGTCLKLRNAGATEVCPLSTMADLYRLVKTADRVLTF